MTEEGGWWWREERAWVRVGLGSEVGEEEEEVEVEEEEERAGGGERMVIDLRIRVIRRRLWEWVRR